MYTLLSGTAWSALVWVPLLAWSACDKMGANAKQKKPPVERLPVRTIPLAKSTYQRAAHAVATVHPWREVSLRAEAPGRILGIKHEVGDLVRQGALLIRLDGAVAWRSYRTATVGIKQARVALNLAKINLGRMRKLRATGDIAQAQLDQAQNAYDSARAALDMAQARTSQAGQQLTHYWVRAPFSGILASRPVNVGDYLSPGSPVFTLVEMRRLKVVVGLDPAEGLHLKVGDPATVSLKTVQGLVARKAHIFLVRPLADSQTRRIELELQVDNPDRLLKPGVMAEVKIPLGRPEKRLLVPSDAVVELIGRHYVYVVRQGKARRLPVKLGVHAGDRVEIQPQGARPAQLGELIVVEGVPRLIPDAPVKVLPSPAMVTAQPSKKAKPTMSAPAMR